MPIVVPLDDVLGDVAPSPAERYGRRQSHTAEHYQERGGGELHRYAQLRQRGERRIHDDRVAGDAGQDIAARGPPHQPGEEVGQEGGEDEYEDCAKT